MAQRAYDAILLDLDGTLLTDEERPHPRSLEALHAAREQGVRVMVVTGRSKVSTVPVLDELELDSLAVIFNGAAVYCPSQRRLIEERTLSNRALERLYAYARRTGDMTVVMCANEKVAREPRSDLERRSLDGLHGLRFAPLDEFPSEYVIRVTFIAERSGNSAEYATEIEDALRSPVYMTHFPLSMLVRHRKSAMQAVDVHPPCRGKAEALRVLQETYGIPRQRVVAVGDATNDAPMLARAGLGVAMGNSMSELLPVADRVIGENNGPALAELVEELFGV